MISVLNTAGHFTRVAFLGQDVGGIFQALAALRRTPERVVNRLDIAGATARGAAEFGFSDGIADANVHGSLSRIAYDSQ
jgi:hypothetical protein